MGRHGAVGDRGGPQGNADVFRAGTMVWDLLSHLSTPHLHHLERVFLQHGLQHGFICMNIMALHFVGHGTSLHCIVVQGISLFSPTWPMHGTGLPVRLCLARSESN